MDIKRAKELINELIKLVDQIDKEEISRIPEDYKNEIQVKVLAILNELDIRPSKVMANHRL
ncbi:MAG: hypothetical protein ACFFB0_17915 [Promethearchaeota archaeon]